MIYIPENISASSCRAEVILPKNPLLTPVTVFKVDREKRHSPQKGETLHNIVVPPPPCFFSRSFPTLYFLGFTLGTTDNNRMWP